MMHERDHRSSSASRARVPWSGAISAALRHAECGAHWTAFAAAMRRTSGRRARLASRCPSDRVTPAAGSYEGSRVGSHHPSGTGVDAASDGPRACSGAVSRSARRSAPLRRRPNEDPERRYRAERLGFPAMAPPRDRSDRGSRAPHACANSGFLPKRTEPDADGPFASRLRGNPHRATRQATTDRAVTPQAAG